MKKKILLTFIGIMILTSIMTACSDSGKGSGSTENNTTNTDVTTAEATATDIPTTDGETTAKPDDEVLPEFSQVVASSIKKSDNGKLYIDLEGTPFVIIGGQIRTDLLKNVDGLKLADMEPYFKVASELGLNCVQVPVQWSDVEKKEGEYRNTSIAKYLSYCKKYGLKMEILWFGSVMCGQSHSNHIPDYIMSDIKRFPKDHYQGSNYMYGQLWLLDVGNDDLIERECAAVTRLMKYVRIWEEENGNPRIVVGFQVENEADSYVRWNPGDWNSLCKLLNAVGNAVKASDYSVFTRLNITCVTNAGESFVSMLNRLEGIDVVGTDPYVFTPREVKNTMNSFSSVLSGYPFIAENSGAVYNNESMLLAAVASGGSYCVYEVMTMKSAGHFTCEFGLVDRELNDKEYTESFRKLAKGLSQASYPAALALKEDFAVFNVRQAIRQKELTQTVTAGGIDMTFVTTNGGVGFGIAVDGYITVFSTEDDTVSFSECTLDGCEIGMYNEKGEWVKSEDASLDGSTLKLTGGKLYRIKATPKDASRQSTAQAEIGCDMGGSELGGLRHEGSEASFSNGVWSTHASDKEAVLLSNKKYEEFILTVDVQLGFIGAPGYGIVFGDGGKLNIAQSWSIAYTTLNTGSKNLKNDAELVGYTFQTYKLEVRADDGQLTVRLYHPNGGGSTELYSCEYDPKEGVIGLYAAGGYNMFSNLEIKEP